MPTFRTARIVLFAFFFSCSVFDSLPVYSAEKQNELNQTDRCQNHPAHTYQVFVPSVDISCRKLPLMVVIDLHGNGKLAIRQFKEAAQNYSVVLIASNQIKNNVSGYLQLLDELIADAKK